MSKIFKSVGSIFGGGPKAPKYTPSYAPQSAQAPTASQMSSRRAGMAASGRELDEEEMRAQFGSRWLEESGYQDFWS